MRSDEEERAESHGQKDECQGGRPLDGTMDYGNIDRNELRLHTTEEDLLRLCIRLEERLETFEQRNSTHRFDTLDNARPDGLRIWLDRPGKIAHEFWRPEPRMHLHFDALFCSICRRYSQTEALERLFWGSRYWSTIVHFNG